MPPSSFLHFKCDSLNSAFLKLANGGLILHPWCGKKHCCYSWSVEGWQHGHLCGLTRALGNRLCSEVPCHAFLLPAFWERLQVAVNTWLLDCGCYDVTLKTKVSRYLPDFCSSGLSTDFITPNYLDPTPWTWTIYISFLLLYWNLI